MHGYGHYEDWQTERESVTQLYVRPVGPRFTPTVQPVVRITSQSFAQARITPQPVASGTMAVTAPQRNWIGIGFLAACVVIGVLIGTVLSLRGGSAIAAPTPVAAAPAPAPHIVVSPIEAPQPAAAVVVDEPPPPAPVVEPAPVVAPAPKHQHHHDAPKVEAKVEAPKAAVAKGTLLVSAKPPCAIAIDGRPTGLMTPQRALPLAAGHHEVTLTNAEEGIQLTADVDISADQSTRLVQDFTK
jgi:hypothetical protein